MSPASPSETAPPPWAPWAVLGLVGCAYLPTLGAGFVWDDIPLVVQNEITGDLGNLPRFFQEDLWASTPGQEGGTGYYRPLMLLSLAVDRALFGLWPGGHHLHNLVWHLVGTLGLMQLARPRLGGWGAVVAGLVFGLHPMQSEAVIWVAARNDPMATALGLWALERVAPLDAGRARFGLAFGLSVLAGLAKESVILLPGVLLALDLFGGRRIVWSRYVPLVSGIGVVLTMRAVVGVDGAGLPEPVGWALLARELHRFGGLLLTRSVIPWPLHNGVSLEWLPRLPVWRWSSGWFALCGALAWVSHRSRQGDRRPAAGLAWFALAVVPVVVPVADKGLIGERYLYFAIAGLGWACGAGAGRSRAVGAGLVAVPAILALQLRIPDWEDDVRLWEAAVRHHPTPYTWGGLAHVVLGEGRVPEAYELFVRALDDPRPDPSVCAATLRAAQRLGRAPLLAQTSAWAARRGCVGADFRGERGISLALAEEWDSARRVAQAPGPRAASGVVLDALIATHDGDGVGLERARHDPAAPPDLDARVSGILTASERATAAAGGAR